MPGGTLFLPVGWLLYALRKTAFALFCASPVDAESDFPAVFCSGTPEQGLSEAKNSRKVHALHVNFRLEN